MDECWNIGQLGGLSKTAAVIRHDTAAYSFKLDARKEDKDRASDRYECINCEIRFAENVFTSKNTQRPANLAL